MNSLENRWKQLSFGFSANVSPIQLDAMKNVFMMGAFSFFDLMQTEDNVKLMADLKDMIQELATKEKLLRTLEREIDHAKNVRAQSQRDPLP